MALNILAGVDWMQGQAEQGRQKYADKLLGQAYAAPADQRQGALADLAGKGFGQMAMQADSAFAQRDSDRQKQQLEQLTLQAKILIGAPPEMRPTVWTKMAPGVASIVGDPSIGQMPWDEATILPLAQQFAGAEAAEPKVLSPGAAMYDSTGKRIAYNEPLPDTGTWSVQNVPVPGGEVQMERNNVTGEWRYPSYGAGAPMGPQTVAGGGGSAPAPMSSPAPAGAASGGFDFTDLVGNGVTMTSWLRTPERNAEVGGRGNSRHLSGDAADFIVPPAQKAAFIQRVNARPGWRAIDEGDHVHVQRPRGGGAAPQNQPMGFKPSGARDDGAPSGYRYTPEGTLEPIPGGPHDPNTERPMTPAQRVKMEQTQRKERQMLAATTGNMDEAVQLIDAILAKSGDFGGVTGMGALGASIPGTDWADLAADIDRLRGMSAFSALQEMRANSPTGGALGSITERELTLLQNAETALQNSQSPGKLKQSLEDYKRRLLDAKRRMQQGVDEFYQDVAPAAPAPSSDDDDALIQQYLR